MARPPAAVQRFNALALHVAGRRFVPLWAIVRHRGRTSGTAYATPVAVLATPSTFVIALPWGPQTQWARNVLAADGCTVRWRGADYACTAPAIVTKQVALAAAGPLSRRVLSRMDPSGGYLQLTRRRLP